MDKATKQDRNQAINCLKMFSVIAIFLIHCKFPGKTGEVVRGAASFGVPVFFLIAGFYSYHISAEKIRKRIRHILWLVIAANLFYLLWDMIYLVLTGENVTDWLMEVFHWKKILVFLLFNETPLRGHLWFLGALLYCYVVLFLMAGKEKTGFLKVGALLLLAGNLLLGEMATALGHNLQIPYVRNWLFCGLPFFFLGYLLKAQKTEPGKEKPVRISPKVLCCIMAVCVITGILEAWLIPDAELYLSTMLLAITAFVYVTGKDTRTERTGKTTEKWLAFIDANASLIYILQVAVIKSIQLGEQRLGIVPDGIMGWLNPFLAFAVTCLLAAAVTAVWKHLARKG